MAGWDDLEQALPLDIRDAGQQRDDVDRLCLRVFQSEDGKKLIEWLRHAVVEQPVALPGSDPSYAIQYQSGEMVLRDKMQAFS